MKPTKSIYNNQKNIRAKAGRKETKRVTSHLRSELDMKMIEKICI